MTNQRINEPISLVHGETYISRDGTEVIIRKERWDHSFAGYSVRNGVFMGYYLPDGTTQINREDGSPCDLIARKIN